MHTYVVVNGRLWTKTVKSDKKNSLCYFLLELMITGHPIDRHLLRPLDPNHYLHHQIPKSAACVIKKIIKCFWSINLISDNNLVFHLFFSCYFDPRFQMFPLGLSHFFKLWEFIKKGHHIPYGKHLTIYQIITQ